MRIALILLPFLSLIFSSTSVLPKTLLFPDPQLCNVVLKVVGLNSEGASALRKEHLLGIEKLNLPSQTPEMINVDGKSIQRLDLSSYPKLRFLSASRNPLGKQGVDLSHHPFLITVRYNRCGLTALDLSANGRLKIVEVSNNQLSNLRLYPTNAIEKLICGGNKLEKLNLSRQRQLKELGCWNNQLSKLDLSTNAELTKLWCANNQLTRIDLSNNPKLIYVDLRGNPLVEIIVADLDRMSRQKFHYDGNPVIREAAPRKLSTDVSPWKFPVFSDKVATDIYDAMIRGKDINEELAAAITANDLRLTAYLLEKGADPNHKTDRFRSMLLTALKQNNYEIGELLLYHGAIIEPNTLIHSSLEGVKWLIAHGADVNARYGLSGDTVLMHAVQRQAGLPRQIAAVIDRIDLLIAHGAEINAKNKSGENALHVAARLGSMVSIRHLLRYNIDATLKNNQGLLALHYLVTRLAIDKKPSWLKDEDASVIEKWENDRLAIIRQVLLQKPDLNARDQSGKTVLYHTRGKMAVLLLEHGADPNAAIETKRWSFYDGATPLMLAASEMDTEWMALLLKYGADPNATDGNGRTALGRIQRILVDRFRKKMPEASSQKYIPVMKKLIDVGGGTRVDRALMIVDADPITFRFAAAVVQSFAQNTMFYLLLFGPLLTPLAIAVVGLTIKKVRRSRAGSTIILGGLISLIPMAVFYAIALSFLGKTGWAAGQIIGPIILYGWITAIFSMVLSSGLFFAGRCLLQRRRERLSD